MGREQDFAARCIDLYKRYDIPLAADLLGVTPVEVSRTLRKARIVTDVQPCELSFIVGKIDAMPDRAISDYLGLSASQLDQILRRHGIRKTLKPERMTLEVCIARTRWLVEERLELPVNDQLPREITNTHFTDHGLYPVVEFATASKARERGMVLPRGSIVSTGTVSKPFNLAAPAARVSARFLGRELGFSTLVRPGSAGPD